MVRLPDPRTAYALLIGASEFDDSSYYQPLPSCQASAKRLAELMGTDGVMWRLPLDHINVLIGRVSADEARAALDEVCGKPDLKFLLVCVSCHGRRYDETAGPPGLHLALSGSRAHLPGTHWHFSEIERMLTTPPMKNKHILLVVDACEADGLAMGRRNGQSSGGDSGRTTVDQLSVPGVVVLTATKYRTVAWPQWPNTSWTAFLGALITSITEGIDGPDRILSAKQIFYEVRRRIGHEDPKHLVIPEPGAWGEDFAEIPLCDNTAWEQPRPHSGPTGPEGSDVLDADGCFASIRAADSGGRGGSIVGIIQLFCGSPRTAIAEKAVLASMLSSSEFHEYLDDVYTASCASQTPAEITAFVHNLHQMELRDGVRLLHGMKAHDHPGLLAVDVYEDLAGSACAECRATAGILAALVVSDPGLAAEAVAVWR